MRVVLYILGLLFLASCASGQSHVKQSADIQNYKNIVVIKFDSPDPGVGYKMTDKIAVRFGSRGFNVLERSKLKKLINEEALVQSGLSASEKAALAGIGVNALILGSVDKYECEAKKAWTWTGFAPEQIRKGDCRASMSVRMVDINSGEVLWEAKKAHAENAEGMTAQTVLGIVLAEIEEVIPRIQE
jgi:curli biogenesis system outer membrane secretion channel CsgG